jgi:hypothetical protein
MTATQVRSRFHALIDRVENTERLRQMYDALAGVEGLPDEITDELTPEQRQRLERSVNKAFDPDIYLSDSHSMESYHERN